MGPMIAAALFLDALRHGHGTIPGARRPARITASLHGSLAFTGKGHATDRAVMLGLLGWRPDRLDPDEADRLLANLNERKCLRPDGLPELTFDPDADLVFDYDTVLPGHANGLVFSAFDNDGNLHRRETYYSTGGGFVVTADELKTPSAAQTENKDLALAQNYPFPFATARQMLKMGDDSGKTIAQMKRANELAHLTETDLNERLDTIWNAMNNCMDRGLHEEGLLPGGLKVKRRAKKIKQALDYEHGSNMPQPHVINDWISVYAMAVNEENAAGGRVVTAPTNGAAGVIPAVIRYYLVHCVGAKKLATRDFLLTAGAIGALIKHNASISGAEVGCQGEVGSAAAMAAAGLCAVLGGSNGQIENAAEIALEHHLGMTCDPAGGLVQVPCIERNALGAIKAVAAASLALRGDGKHCIPLDNCIETLRQTGRDMSEKYKETSLGGLAVNLPEC